MATLKDVAKASGLTVGTVSRVLNNRWSKFQSFFIEEVT